jgi:hypothetical protein
VQPARAMNACTRLRFCRRSAGVHARCWRTKSKSCGSCGRSGKVNRHRSGGMTEVYLRDAPQARREAPAPSTVSENAQHVPLMCRDTGVPGGTERNRMGRKSESVPAAKSLR